MTVVCSLSLIIALLTASLLPTDVILTSFMKNPNGTYRVRRMFSWKTSMIELIFFEDWARNQTARDQIQSDVDIGYYGKSKFSWKNEN